MKGNESERTDIVRCEDGSKVFIHRVEWGDEGDPFPVGWMCLSVWLIFLFAPILWPLFWWDWPWSIPGTIVGVLCGSIIAITLLAGWMNPDLGDRTAFTVEGCAGLQWGVAASHRFLSCHHPLSALVHVDPAGRFVAMLCMNDIAYDIVVAVPARGAGGEVICSWNNSYVATNANIAIRRHALQPEPDSARLESIAAQLYARLVERGGDVLEDIERDGPGLIYPNVEPDADDLDVPRS